MAGDSGCHSVSGLPPSGEFEMDEYRAEWIKQKYIDIVDDLSIWDIQMMWNEYCSRKGRKMEFTRDNIKEAASFYYSV